MFEGIVEGLLGDPEHLALQRRRQVYVALFDQPGLDAGALLDSFQAVAQRADQPLLFQDGGPQFIDQQPQLAQGLVREFAEAGGVVVAGGCIGAGCVATGSFGHQTGTIERLRDRLVQIVGQSLALILGSAGGGLG